MTVLQLIYVAVFSGAALMCLIALWRARTISDPDTRAGLTGLLVTSAGWATAQAVRLFTTTPSVAIAVYLIGMAFGLATIGAWLYFCSAYTGQSYHRNPRLRWAAIGLFVGIISIKFTNPLHQLYFTTSLVTVPFPHVVIDQLGLHWVVTVLAYALTAIGFYMLFRLFTKLQIPTTNLSILVSLTALPVIFDVLGFFSIPWVLKLNYEPIGVAAFALGVLYITEDTFEQIRWTGNQQILDSLNEAVIVVDKQYYIRDYNDPTTELFPELTNQVSSPITEALPAIGQVLEDETGVDDTEDIVIEYDGSGVDEELVRYFLLSVTQLTIGPHSVGYAIVCTDITRLERQRRRLQNQTEQLDGFAAAITHELRNTLAIANGHTDITADAIKTGNKEMGVEAIETVDEATDRMTAIVRELATLARLGQPVEELNTVPFSQTIRRLWDIVKPDGISLNITGTGKIQADQERLEELLRNAGQLAVATAATTLTVTLIDDGFELTMNGERIKPGTEDAFFRYGMAVPDAETGMLGPNMQTLARAQNWEIAVDSSFTDGIRLVITDVIVETEAQT